MARQRQSFLEVDFSYIADPKLREIVQQFHEEAVDAYRADRHVAAVVLSGAVLEGILTFALMRRESEATDAQQGTNCKSKHRVPEWRLEELIEIAVKLKLLFTS